MTVQRLCAVTMVCWCLATTEVQASNSKRVTNRWFSERIAKESSLGSATLEYEEWNPHKRSLLQKPRPPLVVNYTIWKPEDIEGALLRWDEHYPDLISVTTAQDAYDLPTAGTDQDCPFQEDQDGCLNYIATIQDFIL